MVSNFDNFVPNYRQARDRWPKAISLAKHYEALVESYDGNAFGLIEIVKSFTESVCLTILGEFGEPMSTSTPSTTELIGSALKCLGLENTHGASQFDRVISTYNRLADTLTAVRNEAGPIAHGKDGFLDVLTSNHKRAFLLLGDTIINLLLSALEGKEPDLKYTREPYESFTQYNIRIDKSVLVDVDMNIEDEGSIIVINFSTENLPEGVELRIEPSRLLYYIDRQIYIEMLFASDLKDVIEAESDVSEFESETIEPSKEVAEINTDFELTDTYSGNLEYLKNDLENYFNSLGIEKVKILSNGQTLIESVLATADRNMGLDWKNRASLLAKIKVSLRRTFAQFGFSNEESIEYADHLLRWFKIQVSDS